MLIKNIKNTQKKKLSTIERIKLKYCALRDVMRSKLEILIQTTEEDVKLTLKIAAKKGYAAYF